MKEIMDKYKYVILGGVFILGLFLRFYNLSGNPPSLNWDEASNGYNAYSILKTGKDEYGTFLPFSIRSFDDYKPPLYAYLTVPSIALFGLNEFAVRLPSALLGSLSIIVIYFLVLEVLKSSKFSSKFTSVTAITTAFLLAISPWSLQFSRSAYEGNIGLFFLLLGALFLFKFLKNPRFLPVSVIFFLLSMYSYHSFRLIVPIFMFGFGIVFIKSFLKHKLILIISILLFVVFASPIYLNFLSSQEGSGSRLSMVSIFGDSPEITKSIQRLEYDKSHGNLLGYIFENRRFVYGLSAIKGYLDHYNPDFLFIHGDGGRQHHAVDFGMLYLFTFPFILLGIFALSSRITKRIAILFLLLILAPLASAISSGSPHPVRAIIMAPVFDILAAVGLVVFAAYVSGITYQVLKIKLKYVIFSSILILFSINFLYYLHQYYVHTPREYGDFWQYGNKEVIAYAKKYEDSYKKIVITYKYDQPYVYYLFYNQIDPKWYQDNWDFTKTGTTPRFERKIGKYEFRNIEWGKDSLSKDTLFIGTPDEIPESEEISSVEFLDGTKAYRIAAR